MTEEIVIAAPAIGVDMSHDIVYQVTLASGMIVTKPAHFGNGVPEPWVSPAPILAEDGRVLVPAETSI